MRLRLHLRILRVSASALGILLAATGTPALSQCEVQRITTDDTTPWGLAFGTSVAVSGDRAVVGAKYADGIFTVNSGFAYVYRREGTRWVQEDRLAPSDESDTDWFGDSVAISGDHVVVSAMGAEAAYVFRRDETGWVQDAKLAGWDAPPFPGFGRPVSISGDVVVVGSGYVFRRIDGEWLPEQKLIPADPEVYAFFGAAVAVDGDYIMFGSPGTVRDGRGSGWVFVFHYDGTHWVEVEHLIGSDTELGDSFGDAVALNGERALISAPYHDDPFENVGASYVFRRDGTEWIQEAKLTPARAREGNLMGPLALSTECALIGDGDDNAVARLSGAVYVFKRSGQVWLEESKIKSRDPQTGDFFGSRGAIVAGWALITSPGDDHTQYTHGAVYSFALDAPCRSLRDYATLQDCFTGKKGSVLPECKAIDVEVDGDIDLDDHRRFLETLVGPR